MAVTPKNKQEHLLNIMSADRRLGVRALVEKTRRRLRREQEEEARLRRMQRHERALNRQGYEFVAGADEVGRGALAGPLVAAAVILGRESSLPGLNDSKKLSSRSRELLSDLIIEQAVSWAIVEIDAARIDSLGLQAANLWALGQAVIRLKPEPDFAIFDGFNVTGPGVPSLGLVKGDSQSQSVAAASIIAKVHRDRIMVENHKTYPDFRFDENKGYGTAGHQEALKTCGPCELHRRSFLGTDLWAGQARLELG